MVISRTFDLLENLRQYSPKSDILARRVRGVWTYYSIEDYIEYSYNVAYGLLALGYKAGTKIISICNNRPEWNFLDMGSNLAHMIHVPVYSTLSRDEYVHIFTHSDAEIIVIGNPVLYNKIFPIIQTIDRNIKVILMDDSEDIFCFSKLYSLGRQNKSIYEQTVADNVRNISPDECATMIYTSGTTGTPKGVMLSHRNLMFDSHSHAVRQTKNSSHKMLSFLPLCHSYERTMNYEYQELGIGIYYAESMATIASDLADCHADGFCAVPRVLNMMYSKFESAGKTLSGFKGFIYRKAWEFANNFDNYNRNPFYLAKQKLYDKLVYSKWRENLGGHEMLVVSGGSSIQAKVVKTFNAAKLYIFEGYGMTETSPVIAVNSPADKYNRIGTVGKKIEGTELKFAEDGEILTKGPHVMLGYYKDPEATAEMIDGDGFLHTGDIGCLVDGEFLKITDRKKEIFKLSAGKYVAPQVVETLLKESQYIENAIAVGEYQKIVSAIVCPEFSKLKEYAKEHGISYTDDADLIANPAIVRLFHDEIEVANKELAPHENVKRFRLVTDEWTIANDLLSQTLKLKRRNILKKYEKLIEEIYPKENE